MLDDDMKVLSSGCGCDHITITIIEITITTRGTMRRIRTPLATITRRATTTITRTK